MADTQNKVIDLQTGVPAIREFVKKKVKAVDDKVGTTAVADQIKAAVEDLDAEQNVTATANADEYAVAVATGVTQTDGKLAGIKQVDVDKAGSATAVKNALTGDATTATADDLTLNGLKKKIDSAVGEGGDVATQIKTAVEALDADVDVTAATDTNTVSVVTGVTQTDGKVTALKQADADKAGAAKAVQDAVVGTADDLETSMTLNGISKKLNNALGDGGNVATQIKTAIDDLDADKDAVKAETDTDANAVAVVTGVTQVDGKVDSVKSIAVDKAGAATAAQKAVTGESTDTSASLTLNGLSKKIDEATQGINDAISKAYVFKGSVATAGDLPTSGQREGDVYNIVARSDYGMAGTNVAWVAPTTDDPNGHWDSLGTTFQIDYASAAEVTAVLEETATTTEG